MPTNITVTQLHSLFKEKLEKQLNLDLDEITTIVKDQVFISNDNRLVLSETARKLALNPIERVLMAEFLQKMQSLKKYDLSLFRLGIIN